jgi:hypothetical protein
MIADRNAGKRKKLNCKLLEMLQLDGALNIAVIIF